jgi:hypothetical protein
LEKLHWEASSNSKRPSGTGGREGRGRASRGGGDEGDTPDSSYMEEVDIDNSGNVILQSTTQSRVRIDSAREPQVHGQGYQSRDALRATTGPAVVKKSAQVTAARGMVTTMSTMSTLGPVHGLGETESHSSLVEYGTVREVNAAYEDGLDREWQDCTVDTLASHRRGEKGGRDTGSGTGTGSGRSTERSSREVVLPVREFADTDVRASWESDGSSKRHYDPSRYNSRDLSLSRDTSRSARVSSSGNDGSRRVAVSLDDTVASGVTAGSRTSHAGDTAVHPMQHSSSLPHQSRQQHGGTTNGEETTRKSRDRIVSIASDGSKVTTYGNGTIKTSYPDGSTEVRFVNGDTKRQFPSEGKLIYYYAHAKTTHTTFADETELYEFPNGQVCRIRIAALQCVKLCTIMFQHSSLPLPAGGAPLSKWQKSHHISRWHCEDGVSRWLSGTLFMVMQVLTNSYLII